MKILKLSLTVIFLSLGIAACKKPGLIATSNVSNADAAVMLSGALSSNSYGVTNISTDVSLNAATALNANQACGSTVTDTMTRRSPVGSSTSYLYKLSYTHKLTCNIGGAADNISSNLTYSGYFNNPSLSLTNSGNVAFTVGGLTPAATSYVVNGEYKSSGTFKLRPDSTNTGSASIDIVAKNLVVSKSTQTIVSGTATVIVTGTTFKKGDFTYNGIATFTGNYMASLMLNGSNYTINLATGIVTKK
ncbi:MAG: hypothetical protein ACXVAY_21370 [Mucilaginibacter sp.]